MLGDCMQILKEMFRIIIAQTKVLITSQTLVIKFRSKPLERGLEWNDSQLWNLT